MPVHMATTDVFVSSFLITLNIDVYLQLLIDGIKF